MKIGKIIALIIEILAIAVCGAWGWADYMASKVFPFEPFVIVLFAIAAIVGTIYWPKKHVEEEKEASPPPDTSVQGTNVAGDQINHHYHPAPETTSTPENHTLPKVLSSKDQQKDPKTLVGRRKELKALRKALEKQNQIAVINGMGGIGKTSLAEAYVFQHFDEYAHIVWVEQTGDHMADAFVADRYLLDKLKITAEGKNSEDVFRFALKALQNLGSSQNLLVLDNATDHLQQYLYDLPKPPHWHVLVTSRDQMDDVHAIQLDFLDEGDAIALFQQECRIALDEQLVQELVTLVDYHTLSITLLAKTAKNYEAEPQRLKAVFEKDLRTGVHLNHAKKEVQEAVKSYLTSIFRLGNLPEDQIWLLQQFVCLPPEYHPYDLLKELIRPEGAKADDFNVLLSNLTDHGWLLRQPDIRTPSWKMHRLIAEVVREQHPPAVEDVLPLIEEVTTKLEIDETKDNPVDKFPWVRFGLSAIRVIERHGGAHVAEIQHKLAWVLRERGDYALARELAEKALFFFDQESSEEGAAGPYSSNLALVLQDLGDYAGAKTLLEKAMRSDEQNFGEAHPSTARSYSNLATVLKDLGDYAGAKTLLEKAMRSDEQNFGVDHPSTARSYSNLAIVLKALGDYAGAKTLMEKAMRSDEQNFGVDHPSTARSYSNLALVLQALGDYAGAKTLLEKAMRLNEQNLGAAHPTTAVSYSNLATVLKALGDYAGAKTLLEKAMRSDEQNFGVDHPTTAVSYSNLALVLKDLGDYERALPLAEKALGIFEKVLPGGHPNITTMRGNVEVIRKVMEG